MELGACGLISVETSFGIAADAIRTRTTIEWPRPVPTAPATTATPSLERLGAWFM